MNQESGVIGSASRTTAGIFVLKRALSMRKPAWRSRSIARSLPPIEIDPLILNWWRSQQGSLPTRSIIEIEATPDGSASGWTSRVVQKNGSSGPFEFRDTDQGEVAVILEEEMCRTEVGLPSRRTRQIALLRPWRPVCVILNGRRSYHNGQVYTVQDYHLVLADEHIPDAIGEVRLVDLQEILF